MSEKQYTVAIVGATGAVGGEMASILSERAFPVGRLVPLASANSLGKEICFGQQRLPVEVLGPDSFDGVDIALFSAGGEISREFAPIAARAGAVVIDNTSAFRMDEDVPLVIPEVNPEDIALFTQRRIIANPNCSTIQMVLVLAPLHARAHIKRVVVDTYQSVSGAGLEAMEELSQQSVGMFSSAEMPEPKVFSHRIAFNCIPQIGPVGSDGISEEERKLVLETPKIMHAPDLRVAATAVRVPVFCAHSEAIHLELAEPLSPEQAREILNTSSGIEVVDDVEQSRFPMAIDAVGKDPVFVGRIRRDATVANGLSLWIVSDNLRKGAALNAVQIAEVLVREYV